jgi:hypothetical protein
MDMTWGFFLSTKSKSIDMKSAAPSKQSDSLYELSVVPAAV